VVVTGEFGTTGTSATVGQVLSIASPSTPQGGNVIVSGVANQANGLGNVVNTGTTNAANGFFSVAITGANNVATGPSLAQFALDFSRLAPGLPFALPIDAALVLNGQSNTVSGQFATDIDGQFNLIDTPGKEAVVVDGIKVNVTNGVGNVVVDGTSNVVSSSGNWNAIISGKNNLINGTGVNDAVLGGTGNVLSGSQDTELGGTNKADTSGGTNVEIQ